MAPLKGKKLHARVLGLNEGGLGVRGVEYLVIDEFSMVGEKLLMMIDSRLQQRNEESFGKPFGGISILMAGDLY